MRKFAIAVLVLMVAMILTLPFSCNGQEVVETPIDTAVIIDSHADSVQFINGVFGEQTGLIDEALEEVGFKESILATIKLINFLYIFVVIVTYYIVVTRIPIIPTNTFAKRNLVIGILSVVYGIAWFFWQKIPFMNLFISGLSVNFAYEFIAKFIFRGMEKLGWLPLPEWYLKEIKAENARNVAHVEASQTATTPTPPER